MSEYWVRWNPSNKLWEVSVDGGSFSDLVENSLHEQVTFNEIAAPATSGAGKGRIYFDSTLKKFRVSEDNGAYKNLLAADAVLKAGDTMTGPLIIQDATDTHIPFKIVAPGVAGGGEILPTAVAGLQGWWKADAAAYNSYPTLATNGQGVSRWDDQSGNGRNLTSAAQPTFQTNVINGKPVLRFTSSGGTHNITSGSGSSFVAASAKTVFMVGRATSGGYFTFYNAGSRFEIGRTASNLFYATNDDGASDSISKAATDNVFFIGSAIHNGTTLYVGVSDTRTASLASVASGASVSLSGSSLLVGQSGGVALDGDIAELVIFNTVVSESDRKGIEAYLANKYALTIPYSVIQYSNADLFVIVDASANEAFRIDKDGKVYVRGVLVH